MLTFKNYLPFLLCFLLIGGMANAQGLHDVEFREDLKELQDEYIPEVRQAQHDDWRDGEYLMPAKPRNMWALRCTRWSCAHIRRCKV